MTDEEILFNIQKISESEPNVSKDKINSLALKFKENPKQAQEIMDLFNDLNGIRFRGDTDRFHDFLRQAVP